MATAKKRNSECMCFRESSDNPPRNGYTSLCRASAELQHTHARIRLRRTILLAPDTNPGHGSQYKHCNWHAFTPNRSLSCQYLCTMIDHVTYSQDSKSIIVLSPKHTMRPSCSTCTNMHRSNRRMAILDSSLRCSGSCSYSHPGIPKDLHRLHGRLRGQGGSTC